MKRLCLLSLFLIIAASAHAATSNLPFINDDYPKGIWIEPQYRKAILDLEQTDGVPVSVTRSRTTPSGRTPRGLKLGDVVKFGER